MKKRLGVLLVLVLALAIWCGVASAKTHVYTYTNTNTPVYKDNTETWQYIEVSGGLAIEKFLGTGTVITIPARLDGQSVVAVSSYFKASNATSVIISAGVKRIEGSPFANLVPIEDQPGYYSYGDNTTLQSVVLPDTLEAIGEKMLISCTALESIVIPDSVQSIGRFAFGGCSSLSQVEFGSGVTQIGDQAFCDTALTSVTLPDSVVSIGAYAFGANSLTEIDIPDSVTSLALPIVSYETTMIVGKDSEALKIILAEGYNNYRIRGEEDTPEITDGDTVEERVNNIVSTIIDASMTDYAKAKTLHDYLIQHAQYHVMAGDAPTESAVQLYPRAFRPEGVLLDGAGVCQSYAEAYQLLLNEVGIPNTLEHGANHVWNMVYIDGGWTHVDCTWDDPTLYGQETLESSARSGRENNSWFGLTNEAIEKASMHECFDKPHIATDYTLNYVYRLGGLDSRINEVIAVVEDKLTLDPTTYSFVPESFGTDNYGVAERTAILAINDRLANSEYMVDGANYAFSVTYDSSTCTVTATAELIKTEVTFDPFTLSRDDTFALPGCIVREVTGVALLGEGNVISFRGVGEATVVAEYETSIVTRVIHVQELNTLTITAETVEDEAFDATGAERIVVGAGVKSIGPKAFANCQQLLVVRFEGNTEIDPTILLSSNPSLTVIAPVNSYVMENLGDFDIYLLP